MSSKLRHLSAALAILVFIGIGYWTLSAADPGDDEVALVLTPKEGDTPAVRQFKETGKNPYNKDPEAIAEGFKLARASACTHCHAGDLSGLLGPSLATGNWRYPKSGTDKGMFQTLYFGSAGGMAAWGKLGSLTEDELLKIIAFVRSKYRGDPKDITWE